jgi:hypothetical protein
LVFDFPTNANHKAIRTTEAYLDEKQYMCRWWLRTIWPLLAMSAGGLRWVRTKQPHQHPRKKYLGAQIVVHVV